MDFLLWILSWFEFPIAGILFFIGVPVSIIFMIVTFRNLYRESEKEKTITKTLSVGKSIESNFTTA